MQASATKQEKLIQEFGKLNFETQDAFLELIEMLGTNSQEATTSASIVSYNNEMSQAESDMDNGEYFTEQEAFQQIKSWKERLSK